MASLIRCLSYGITSVTTLRRSCGAVVNDEMSRTPTIDMCSVRGMGVADIVSTSTVERTFLSRSLCVTPNRCSSSITTSPKSENFTSSLRMRCVPMRISTSPALARFVMSFASFPVFQRLIDSMLNGYAAIRSLKLR
jgi:hypothetical protein